ncbi:MAG: RHS repeat-associated core domain-containing protein [Syntrophobacteraceae bacterium]
MLLGFSQLVLFRTEEALGCLHSGIKDVSAPAFWDSSYFSKANGNLEHQTYRRSETEDVEVWYEYDGLNRPIVKKYPDPEVQPDVQYFYDESGRANGVGRLTRVIDASGLTSFDYDYAGRVTASSTRVNIGGQLTDPYTLNRTYDALGRISSITYPAPDNETIQYGYDNNGNLGSVTRVGGACYAAFSDYNAAGQPGNIQFYNGASTLLEYYPSNNRLKSVTTNANDLVQEIRYTAYDKNGNVKSIEDGSEAVKTFAYGYDGLNRLRTADSSAYSGLENIGLDYAGVGNIWKNSITGTDTFPAERELVYDYDNRLAAINTDSGMTTFVYNYQGERVIKQSGNSTTIYIGGLFEDKDGVRIKHLFAGDRRIVSRIGSAAYYYHPDHLGGLSVITNSDGDVAQKAAYYPFGQQIDPVAETDPLPYRFTGQELDTETGLYYYKSRYYDPMIGRFISPDPLIQAAFDPPTFPRLIGFDYEAKEAPIMVVNSRWSDSVAGLKDGSRNNTQISWSTSSISLNSLANPFSYAFNNPTNNVDLLGLKPGDIYLFTYTPGGLARYIGWVTPGGKYGHAGIELTNNRFLTAEGSGAVIKSIGEALNGASYDVFRPKGNVDEAALEKFAYWAAYYNSDGYHVTGALGGWTNKSILDVDNMDIAKEYYCSEITWFASMYSGNNLGWMGSWILPNNLSQSNGLYKLMLGDILEY